MAKSPIKALLIDIESLVRHERFKAMERLAEFSNNSAAHIAEVIYREKNSLADRFEKGELSPQDFYFRVRDAAGLNRDITFEMFCHIWSTAYTDYLPIAALLSQVKDDIRQKMILCTNIDPISWNFIKEFSVFKMHFPEENIVRSYEVGSLKPNRRIYIEALRRAGLGEKEMFKSLSIEGNASFQISYIAKGGRSELFNCAWALPHELGNVLYRLGLLK
ncbi:MAG TPA: hypothetical protein VD928_01245 [Candidatus Paceibacterota bacterium]|nr:hypothetical protein [Candidatus Paceibacterota bacterium]